MDKILVFGHKNPDTDTICSSIVMAKIVNELGYEAEAVRLGKINKETEYVFTSNGYELQEVYDGFFATATCYAYKLNHNNL